MVEDISNLSSSFVEPLYLARLTGTGANLASGKFWNRGGEVLPAREAIDILSFHIIRSGNPAEGQRTFPEGRQLNFIK
jgi:hypothetical protein